MVTGDGSFFRQDLLPIYKYHAIICIRVREITFVTLCNPNHTICTRINAFCSTIGTAVNFCVTLSGYINGILCISFKFRTRTANVRYIRDTNCIFRVGIHHAIRNPNRSIILCNDCGCGCVCSIAVGVVNGDFGQMQKSIFTDKIPLNGCCRCGIAINPNISTKQG